MTYLQKIIELSSELPYSVLRDINTRVRDWLASGGGENDPYIAQQLRFAQNYLKMRGEQ
ncbi:hypothetical protein MYW48_23175 [Bacillus cereus]|uniref:DUF6877 family protein n=1 Tax=Bacillus cereus TaxID=1396 RepID=UPI001FFD5C0F|nr:DUF6877 family protein [Bacillus cereus]UPJ15594.1 hypothetical protein MYW48_23175 [Bacillus cereus]